MDTGELAELHYADGPSAEASIDIAAPPERVWALVSDLQLPARFSTEFQGADLLGGVQVPELGATQGRVDSLAFVGDHRQVRGGTRQVLQRLPRPPILDDDGASGRSFSRSPDAFALLPDVIERPPEGAGGAAREMPQGIAGFVAGRRVENVRLDPLELPGDRRVERLLAQAPVLEELHELELVLLADATGSIDDAEIRFQRQGYAEAITHPDVVNAIASTVSGRIAVTYVEWGNVVEQDVVVDWTIIDGAQSAAAFAEELMVPPRRPRGGNAIGAALLFGKSRIEGNAIEGMRRVIDISAGFIVVACGTGMVLWLVLPRRRILGALALALGIFGSVMIYWFLVPGPDAKLGDPASPNPESVRSRAD